MPPPSIDYSLQGTDGNGTAPGSEVDERSA